MIFRFPYTRWELVLKKFHRSVEALSTELRRLGLETAACEYVRLLSLELETEEDFVNKANHLLAGVRELHKTVAKQQRECAMTARQAMECYKYVSECYGIAVDIFEGACQVRISSEMEEEPPVSSQSPSMEECEQFAADALCSLSQTFI